MRKAITYALPIGGQLAHDMQRLEALILRWKWAIELQIGIVDVMDADTDKEPSLAGDTNAGTTAKATVRRRTITGLSKRL